MAERDPLYLATDSAGDPSALAVFATGDTIPSGFMSSSLSATDITTLTGTFTNITATNVTGTNITNTDLTVRTSLDVTAAASNANFSGYLNVGSKGIHSISAMNVSSNVGLLTSSVGSLHTSASLGGDSALMPTPPPLIWLRIDDDGTAGTAEANFGDDSTVIGVSSVPDYFIWDHTDNELYVSANGFYKISATCIFTNAATQSVLLRVKVNDEIVHYVAQEVHSVTDPHIVPLVYVGFIRVGQPIAITRIGASGHSITMNANSTVLVERVG